MGSRLRVGESLSAGEYLLSENGLFSTHLQADGNLISFYYQISDQRRVAFWDSGAVRRAGAMSVRVTDQGCFEVCADGVPRRSIGCPNVERRRQWKCSQVNSPFLCLQNDSNLVLYTTVNDGRTLPLWASNTVITNPLSLRNLTIPGALIVDLEDGTISSILNKRLLNNTNLPVIVRDENDSRIVPVGGFVGVAVPSGVLTVNAYAINFDTPDGIGSEDIVGSAIYGADVDTFTASGNRGQFNLS